MLVFDTVKGEDKVYLVDGSGMSYISTMFSAICLSRLCT